MLGWGLVLGVVAIAGLPPLGIFMSEFLVVSSTFARAAAARDPAGVRPAGRLRRAAAAAQRHRLRRADGQHRAGQGVLRADVRPSGAGAAAGIYLPAPLVAWFQAVARAAGMRRWRGESTRRSSGRLGAAAFLPLPVLHGERVGVRGGGHFQRRSKWPPLTLTLSY